MRILAWLVGQGECLILSSVWLTAEITSDNLSTESLAFLLLLKLPISGICLLRAQNCFSQSQQEEGWEQETSGVGVGGRNINRPCVVGHETKADPFASCPQWSYLYLPRNILTACYFLRHW